MRLFPDPKSRIRQEPSVKQYIFCLQDFFLLDTTNWKWSGNIYRVHFRLCAKKIFGSVNRKQIKFSCNPLFHLIKKKVLVIWYCLNLKDCFHTLLCIYYYFSQSLVMSSEKKCISIHSLPLFICNLFLTFSKV